VRQVATAIVSGTWGAGDTETYTIANVDFVITIGANTTTAGVATTIKEALNGDTLADTTASCVPSIADLGAQGIPQFGNLSATVSSSTVTITTAGTGVLAGTPFTMTEAETTAGDGAVNYTNAATAATSRNHANQADNWDGNAVPGNGDTVIFDTGSVDCLWELDLGAIAVTQFTKYKSYNGKIGLARTNVDDSANPYPEYRTPQYLTADGFTNADLEVGAGPGSGRIKLDGGTVASVYNVFGKGTRETNGVPCILLIGNNNSNVVRNLDGDVGLAFYGGETFTCTTLINGSGPTSQAETYCSSGVTFNSATVTINGGSLTTNSALATGVANGGIWKHGAGTITSLTVNKGAKFWPTGAATITTLDLNGGEIDCTKGVASFAITNTITMSAGSTFRDPQGRTGNVVIQLIDCTLDEVTIIHPRTNKTITFS